MRLVGTHGGIIPASSPTPRPKKGSALTSKRTQTYNPKFSFALVPFFLVLYIGRVEALHRVFDADVVEVQTNESGIVIDITQGASSHRLRARASGGGGTSTGTMQRPVSVMARSRCIHTRVRRWR